MRAERYVTADNRDEAVRRWQMAIGRVAAPRPRWRLDLAIAGLIVVDVQRAFCAPDGAHFLPAFEACAGPLARLLEVWRAAGRPVFFTRHGHVSVAEASVHGRFWGSVLGRGATGWELVAPAIPLPAEPVIDKDTYDAFSGTGLERALRESGCRQVLVAGVLTHLCVETTVRAAFVRGFEPFVAMDACAANLERLHEGALVAMAAGFAGVLTVDEVGSSCR